MAGVAKNFLDFAESLYSGIRWGVGNVGRRLVGVPAILFNASAEGVKQAVLCRLPGHPDQAPDAADMSGASRDLFKYRLESNASWSNRIKAAWDQAEQDGSPQAVLTEINTWGAITFPSWTTPVLGELDWANFTVSLAFGSTSWQPALAYNDPNFSYNDGKMYNVSDASAVDVDHLRRIIRRRAPARSKAKILVPLENGFFYNGGVEYNEGFPYVTDDEMLILEVP